MSIPPPIEAPPPPIKSSEPEEDEEDDDDPWDVEMELTESTPRPTEETQLDVSMMLARHATQDATRLRTFKAFLDDSNVLATYRPSHTASPLSDEKTAQIFCHFVAATGPCLSIFERQASTPSVLFSNTPIPASQKTLWTYELPSLALNHPPLMHAILAVSALHIAKLQQTSEGPSFKHFTYALRRVSKLIGLPKRRNECTTLAANLLLGFYEVMLADHSKWNIHLSGARILVMEIDFAGWTRKVRRMRAQAKARIAETPIMGYEDYIRIAGIPETLLPDKDWEIDEGLVSRLTGIQVHYDSQFQVKASPLVKIEEDLTSKDIESLKVQSDLYWWYCKQDIFQGMVSGNRLLMPYEHWTYCPPRGQIGKLENTYATMDYLCLIMARITDFGGKDRKRKLRMIAAQGQWRPPPGLFGPPKPSDSTSKADSAVRRKSVPGVSASSSTTFSAGSHGPNGNGGHSSATSTDPSAPRIPHQMGPATSPGSTVPMYGMMPPPTGPIKMHSAFNMMAANLSDTGFQEQSPTTPTMTPQDLETETRAALAEHASIAKAFDLFAESLGPEYSCLPADAAPPISTPFGPALQYRTHPIACIWAFYYVGRILIHRMHPHMPPAAMLSAGVTAHLTATYAQTVGKICAGLYCPQQYSLQTGNLNPNLGGALMESTFPLFFAAVQFQDAGQRGWTISKLRDIARLTGWQTSAAVAAGCEICWERMGQAGKGPTYTPTMDRSNKDERVSGKSRRGPMNSGQDSASVKREGGKGGEDEEPPSIINHDRRFINVNPSARVHWALGLLSVEDDLEKLDLDK